MQIGDIVYLKSGSRPMTIISGDTRRWECAWDGGSASFPEAALTASDPIPALQHARDKALAQVQIDDPLPEPKEPVSP